MSVFYNIGYALDYQLKNMGSVPPIAWENKIYKPIKGTLYLRATNMTGDATQAGLGDSGEDENLGVYQVDVFAPADKGKKAALQMADLVANRFKRGTDLTYSGTTVRISSVNREAALTVDGWYHIPVNINYYSITQPRT